MPVLTGGAADTGNPSEEEVRAARPGRRRRLVLTVVKPVTWVAAVAAAVTIIYLIPRTTGTTWDEIGRTLGKVSFTDVLVLTGMWALALFCYSFVLTGSLPGLRRRRAMTLNLTGSAVANVVPLGGAWGVGLNTLMLRRWGYAGKDIAGFLMISNVWNILAKLAVSAVVIGMLAVGGLPVPVSAHGARAVVISAAVAVVLIIVMLASQRASRLAGRVADTVLRPLLRLAHIHRVTHLSAQLPAVRRVMVEVVRARWPLMSVGMVLYLSLQATLLWVCLEMVGNEFTFAAVLTAFAVDRLLTAVPLTPGGSGVVEAGTAAALVALGGAPASVAAAVLLYRAFTFLAEIPVGGVWALTWFAVQRRLRTAATVPLGGVG
ncbi:MAG: YbhN family protein [Actinomycetota bacterium]|nr:YbhN family protein [Actinomycetota bacterium]